MSSPSRATHVVVVTNGLSALLGCHLEASRLLRRAGHRVTFVCPAARAPVLVDNGEDVVALDHDDRFGAEAADGPVPPLTDPRAVLRWVAGRRRLRAASRSVDDLREAVRSLEPDLVVIDVEANAAVVATADLGMPRVLAMSFFTIFRGADVPPLHSRMAAPTGRRDQLAVRLRWAATRVGAVVARWRHRLSPAGLVALVTPMRLGTVDDGDLRAIAHGRGLDLGAIADRGQWLRPFVARDLPVLCYNAVEMDLPHAVSPRLHYVGPLVRLDRAEPALDPDDAERWAGLVGARAAARSGGRESRPLVYATLGTVWSADDRVLDRVLEVFRRRPDWDLVLGLGGVTDPGRLTSVPANALVLTNAPQLAVLAEADAVVTHGGSGTLREAVRFGVPSVVCSTGHVDQNGNAVRVTHHRLGVVVGAGRGRPDAEELERSIARALTDPEIRAGVAALQARCQTYADGGALLAAVLAALPPPVP